MDTLGKLVEYLEMMYGGPIPPMMLTWGVIFLFMAAGGKLIGMKATGWRRWAIMIIGLIFLLAGLRVYIRPLPVRGPLDGTTGNPAVLVTGTAVPAAPVAEGGRAASPQTTSEGVAP